MKKRMKEDEKLKTEWVLCSEDWRDIVTTYVPQINKIAIEDTDANISQEEIKKSYLKCDKRRRPQKRVK